MQPIHILAHKMDIANNLLPSAPADMIIGIAHFLFILPAFVSAPPNAVLGAWHLHYR